MTSTTIASTGIAYDRDGIAGAPTVVLLHAGVADRDMWSPQWPALTSRYDVVRLDLRGYGASVVPPEDEISHHEDVLATLRSIGVDRAHLVACSLGAGVAVEVALAAPEFAASLHLSAPGGSLIAAMTPQLREFVRAEVGALESGDLDTAVQVNLDWWVDGPRRGADAERAGIRESIARMQRRAFEIAARWEDESGHGFEEAELEPSALDRLGDMRARTAVLVGALDLDAITIAAAAVADGVAGARVTTWDDVAHLPSLEKPEAYAAMLSEWLAEA